MRAFCFLSAVAMRSDPSDRAEMVNQLLQGDTFEILEQQEKWSLVRCDYDGYEGWVDNKQWKPTTANPNMSMGNETSPATYAEQHFLDAPDLLLRDASQQATQGLPIDSIPHGRRDDLCFFCNPQGRIIHVGIYMGDNRIIHASGQVRIDTLTPEGIFNHELNTITHKFHSIRTQTIQLSHPCKRP